MEVNADMEGPTEGGGPLFCSWCGVARCDGERCQSCGMLFDCCFPNGATVEQRGRVATVLADFGDELIVRGFLDNGVGPFTLTWRRSDGPIVEV